MNVQSVERAPPLRERLESQEVVVLQSFGGPEGLELCRQPMPTAERGEVRVRVLAACVQFTDVIIRKGKYPGLRQKPPLVLGYDVIGEIDRVGPGEVAFRVGDRIAALTVTGVYARYRTLAATDRASVARKASYLARAAGLCAALRIASRSVVGTVDDARARATTVGRVAPRAKEISHRLLGLS